MIAAAGIAIAMLSSGLAYAVDAAQAEKTRFVDTAVIVGTVKENLRNPESVKWELIAANDDATVVCMQYRAQNGFGGMSREIMVYAKGKASQTTEAWNRHCAGNGRLNNMDHVGPFVDKVYARVMK